MARQFLSSVRILNYKSIGRCNVELRPFSLLVGPNGAGKSNFLDALRFVSESLRTTLEHALRDRGGIKEVRRRSRGHPTHFGIALSLRMKDGVTASYAFRVGALPDGGFQVQREECRIFPSIQEILGREGIHHHYVVEAGTLVEASTSLPDRIGPDRLYLPLASSLPGFRPVYDALSRMGFYNLNPDRVRDLQDPDPGDLLARDGRNMASVVRRLREDSKTFERIIEYLRAVIPGVTSVEPRSLGPKETLEFRQEVRGDPNPWRFLAANMSDGTLRVFGVLVAVFQAIGDSKYYSPLIGIEEPEVAIHPGAAAKLMDALLEARDHTQILVTTHSPDLLDHEALDPDSILAVSAKGGETIITPVDEATRRTLRDRLYTVGELLRLGQIEPDEKVFEQSTHQLDLFGPG